MRADIGAQCIHVVNLPPEPGVGYQEVAHLRAFQIEDQPPGRVRRIAVVDARAVEPAQFLPLAGDQWRNPIENDPDIALVAKIDERHQFLGPAITRIGRIVTRHRLALGPERQLDMGCLPLQKIRQDNVAQLTIAGDALGATAGGFAESNPVRGDRQFPGGRLHGARHPGTIVPVMAALEVTGERGGLGINLGLEGQRVGFEKHRTFRVANFVFVQFAQAEIGDKQFPHPGFMALHRVPAAIPLVEGSDHADPTGVGRPEGEINTDDARLHPGMRAQLGEQPFQDSSPQRLAIGGAKGRFANGVGVVEGDGLAAGIDRDELIVQFRDSGNPNGEQAVRVQSLQLALTGAVGRQHVGAFGLR